MARYALTCSAAGFELVTAAEAKTHLRIDHTSDDTYIGRLISAAGEIVEAMCDASFRLRTWTLKLERFPPGRQPIELPKSLAVSVVSSEIIYYDSTDTQATFEDVILEDQFIVPPAGEYWPSVGTSLPMPVFVSWTAGYANAAAVPELIKQATLLVIGSMYEHREETVEGAMSRLPFGVKDMLMPFDAGNEFSEFAISASDE
jgi:uncharacterized phiE125 gp8 family phage protein